MLLSIAKSICSGEIKCTFVTPISCIILQKYRNFGPLVWLQCKCKEGLKKDHYMSHSCCILCVGGNLRAEPGLTSAHRDGNLSKEQAAEEQRLTQPGCTLCETHLVFFWKRSHYFQGNVTHYMPFCQYLQMNKKKNKPTQK